MPSTYDELVAEFPLRPLHSERQLKRASDIAFELAARSRLSRDARDYLEVLSQVIAAYEAQHHPIGADASPRDVLQFLIDENELTLTQLSSETGINVSTLSEIMHGRRELNLQHVSRLAARFCVEPGLFIERMVCQAH